jgi:cytochrome c oxidase assembly protein Cox11
MTIEKDEIHLFPFNSKHTGRVEFGNCDLTGDKTQFRGVNVLKENMTGLKIYENQRELKGNVYYWKVDSVCFEDKLSKGLKLMDEGLGFNRKETYKRETYKRFF